MYMKVFPHGQGGGEGPTKYLVRLDYPGREENPPEVLRGDLELTHALIDSLDTKWKFTAGVLSWHPDDMVTPEQERKVMDDFESVAFAGLEADQRNIAWVRHSHAGHHELHFVIPRVELSSGKAFNPCPPGWQKHFDVFRDLHNHREGWARPDDPARARLHTPEHADLQKARFSRWGKTPGKDDRTEAKEAITAYLKAGIEQGHINNRADVLQALTEAGLEINRAGKDYLTVKDPESGEKLRLKGGIYAEQWNFAEFAGRAHEGQDRAGTAGNRESDPATIQQLATELERIIEKRAQYNRGRYPVPTLSIGKERGEPLLHSELDVRQTAPASPALELRTLLEPDLGRLGLGTLGNEPDVESAPGNRAVESPHSRLGNNSHSVEGQDVGVGADREQGGPLYYPSGQNHPQNRLDLRESPSHQIGVSHDRTGTDTQKYPDPHGAGNTDHFTDTQHRIIRQETGSGSPRRSPEKTASPGQPVTAGTTGIRTALATLERYTQELGTTLVALERLVERQIERVREQQRQRSRGPGMER
jgi:hypothetical protein